MLAACNKLNRHALYWIGIVVIGLAMEGVALYYQYGLNYGPCILCVHVRAWVLAIVLVAAVGLFFRRHRLSNGIAHGLMLALAVGLLLTSWETLAIERGWTEAACEMKDEFPAWLPLHTWFPSTFQAWELCGYTPELLFGITMAEGLVVIAAVAILLLLLQLVALVTHRHTPHEAPPETG